MIKILSWNIRQGGGSRISAILAFLRKADADVLVLSEFRNNARGVTLRSELMKSGYRYQCVSPSGSEVNSVSIVSKYPGNCILHMESDPIYGSNLLEFNLGAFSIMGGYFPHKKHHVLFDYIQSMTERDHPFILCGDLNTGINRADQQGDSFWYEDDFKRLVDGPMVDAFRLIQGDISEFSWFSHGGNGYRYDHCLVSSEIAFLVDDCDYLQDAREKEISDHAPMILTLNPTRSLTD